MTGLLTVSVTMMCQIRAELDKLKVEITRALGHFPAELEDAALSGGLGSRGPSPAWSDNAGAVPCCLTPSFPHPIPRGSHVMCVYAVVSRAQFELHVNRV